MQRTERVETVVVGGGQAGLSVGYHLGRLGRPCVILNADARIGDSWRRRWDSLRLFTPARYDGLDGFPFPAPAHSFPTKDEMADYLEAYAARFDLPVRSGVRVDRLSRRGERYIVSAGNDEFETDNVVVAMSNFQQRRVPAWAERLDPDIVQFHSSEYRSPDQLRAGGVLIIGAGNSGAEIAMETVRTHPTWLSGRHPGHVPFRIGGQAARFILPVVFRLLFHRLMTVDTPLGRKVRPKATTQGGPLVRVKPVDMEEAGIVSVPRTEGVADDGRPRLADGRVMDVANVIWCTGFQPGFSWIDLPGCGPGEPAHQRGLMAAYPGLYFVGLHFLYAMSSVMIHGVGRDARRIARHIARSAPRAAVEATSPASGQARRTYAASA
jgi:putative flavoprotein involved in K+ transport